uniref:Uncharacterized protein n=1 Tax=Panagrolaimus sp. JU765 TaxID=591449 RepID=A0AC34REE2_9BILA
MCPAIFIPNNSSISSAVKHIYSRLSANATELDQGIPDILLSLVPTTATFNLNTKEKLTKGLGKVVSVCGLWLVISGEQSDPLSSIATSVVKKTLPTSDLTEETLVIVANTVDVAYRMNSSTVHHRIQPMTDTSINTYYFVFNRRNLTLKQKHEFRSQAAIKLANPPPALLIGVPVETSSGSNPQTPSGSTVSPAIILPNSVKYDRRPLSASVFCGDSLSSIYELKVYLDCGVPCLIIHDVSDLCALLRTCHVYYQSANFDHDNFISWLQCELRAIMAGSETDVNLEEIQEAICQCMQLTMGGHSLLHFVGSDAIDNLPEHIVELLMRCAGSNEEYRQIMNLAVKLNISSVLTSVQISSLFNDEQFESLLVDALCRDSRINAVDALISIQPSVHVTPKLLMEWLDATIDQDFFNIVVVGQCLGYSNKLHAFTEYFANDMDYLLYELSKGIANLFPSAYFSQRNVARDQSTSIQILAIWALCLNRVELVKCLWAHSSEPLSLALILSRIAKSLAFEAREFFFYEEQLTNLSKFLTKAACTLLDQAYLSSPRPAYQTLCRKLPYNSQTLSSLAYATNNKEFIAHGCCQRWVLRLLYGNLQFGQIFTCVNLPKWLKIVLSATLVFPIKIWVSIRPPNSEFFSKTDLVKPMSPTVALLETGRPIRRIRTHSTHSTRSFFHREEGSTVSRDDKNYGGNTAVQMGTETPKSVVGNAHHLMNDETDAMLHSNEIHKSSAINRSMTDFVYRRKTTKKMMRTANFLEFYRTPIVKYWLSLVSRLVYLLFFGYTVALPGCGNTTFDVILWIWTCFWLLDNVWVIHCRSCYGQLSNMPWTILDAVLVASFLLILMICEATGHLLMHYVSFPSAYLVKVIWGCLLLYQCYATLFLYIPLSDLFGPLMVRIKLMITRDFVNFLILVSLLICSSAIAMKAIVYPDLEATPSVIKESLSWAWMSLFTTDLSQLEQSAKCKSSLLPSNNREYCTSVGGYGNPKCPANSPASFMVVIEYLIILKLIAWPILFALFSKTAKEVDEEADKIWKYQLYGLATDFSYRLMFPPPFTPIALLFYACCGEKRCLSGLFISRSFTSVDHPDVYKPTRSIESNQSSPSKYSVIYQNPSVPQRKYDPTRHFYSQAAMEYWKNYANGKEKMEQKLTALKKQMEEKMHYLIVASSFNSVASRSEPAKHWNQGVIGEHHRIVVHPKFKSWDVLLPDYNPPEYSKPVQEYTPEMQKYVDHTTPYNLPELTKHWRQKKLHELLAHEKHLLRLSVIGLPLNPSGRTGLGGRGSLIRFGPNRLIFYIIFARSPTKQLMVLTTNEGDLPSKPKYDHNRADDFLSRILTLVGVPDGNVQILSTRGHLLVGQVDNLVAHVCTQPLPLPEDTDNAWTEADVWAINLTEPTDYQIQRLLTDFKWKTMPTTFAWPMRVEFIKQALQYFSLTGN